MIGDVLIVIGLFCLGLFTLALDWGLISGIRQSIAQQPDSANKAKAAFEFALCLVFMLVATAGAWVTFFTRLSALLPW